MSWIDIVIIVIVALCALIGISKGFYKSAVSLFGNFLAAVAAFLLTKTVTLAVLEIPAVNGIVFGSIYNWVYGMVGGLITPDSFIYKFIEPLIKAVAPAAGLVTQAQGVALYLSYLVACLAVFIILFIIIKIITSIIFKILGSLINRESPGMLSRLLGLIVGAAKGALYVVVLMLVLKFALPFSFMQPVAQEMLKSTIALPVFDQVQVISDKVLVDTENTSTIERLIEISGIEKADEEDEEDGQEPSDSPVVVID